MPIHLCALEGSQFEKTSVEFVLASFADFGRDLAPHVGDEDDILQCRVTAKFAEDVEISSGVSGKPGLGDPVDEDDPGELIPCLITVGGVNSKDRELVSANVHSHGGQ